MMRNLLFIVCALLFATTPALAETGRQPIGLVKTAGGDASILREGHRVAAQPGKQLFQGDVLSTGPGGALGIILRDDTVLSIVRDPPGAVCLQSRRAQAGNGPQVCARYGRLPLRKGRKACSRISSARNSDGNFGGQGDLSCHQGRSVINAGIRGLPLLVCCVAVLLLAGCSGPKSYVVLLPVDGKVSGEVVVFNAHGSRVLNQSWQATEVSGTDSAPGNPEVRDRAAVEAMAGSVLTAMPLRPVRYILYFETNLAVLTPDSRRMFAEVLKAVKERHPAELSVVGHTDTVGSAKSNYLLGLLRANTIAAQLKQLGANPAQVETASHGESNPLIKTPDDTPEPRNRRIEITIR
jgi:outer membrane protein OmpA-like peptidoglycan-associated protein